MFVRCNKRNLSIPKLNQHDQKKFIREVQIIVSYNSIYLYIFKIMLYKL